MPIDSKSCKQDTDWPNYWKPIDITYLHPEPIQIVWFRIAFANVDQPWIFTHEHKLGQIWDLLDR